MRVLEFSPWEEAISTSDDRFSIVRLNPGEDSLPMLEFGPSLIVITTALNKVFNAFTVTPGLAPSLKWKIERSDKSRLKLSSLLESR